MYAGTHKRSTVTMTTIVEQCRKAIVFIRKRFSDHRYNNLLYNIIYTSVYNIYNNIIHVYIVTCTTYTCRQMDFFMGYIIYANVCSITIVVVNWLTNGRAVAETGCG